MANENEEFVQLFYALYRTTQQTFIKKKKFCKNTYSEKAIKAYLHFFHYKSMDTFKFP